MKDEASTVLHVIYTENLRGSRETAIMKTYKNLYLDLNDPSTVQEIKILTCNE